MLTFTEKMCDIGRYRIQEGNQYILILKGLYTFDYGNISVLKVSGNAFCHVLNTEKGLFAEERERKGERKEKGTGAEGRR